ncbi:MAG TPA: YceI family protein [Bacteroidales bacterium]|nr:YceI family protein [Bacteroidales bacterium]
MKSTIIFFVLICSVAITNNSCSGSVNQDKKNPEIRHTKTYTLNTEISSLRWSRQVDYKHLEKKVKVFGVYADVSLENVQFETNGDAKVTDGNMMIINDKFESGQIKIDLSLTRFYSEDEESFFVNETYPPANLLIQSFVKDSIGDNSYIAKGNLTINEKTMDIEFPVQLNIDEYSNLFFKAEYLMQTSDWPILKQPKPENVNYDKINFSFDLVFDNMVEKSDTVNF